MGWGSAVERHEDGQGEKRVDRSGKEFGERRVGFRVGRAACPRSQRIRRGQQQQNAPLIHTMLERPGLLAFAVAI